MLLPLETRATILLSLISRKREAMLNTPQGRRKNQQGNVVLFSKVFKISMGYFDNFMYTCNTKRNTRV